MKLLTVKTDYNEKRVIIFIQQQQQKNPICSFFLR